MLRRGSDCCNGNMNTSENRLFQWIRSAQITRSQDRWIAGVCGGIADRLGVSPALVRALMLASVLLGGFGTAAYAIGWAMLPDRRTGMIEAEELMAGRLNWSMLAILLFAIIGFALPGVGVAVVALALFAGFALLQWSRRQIERTQGQQPQGAQYAQSQPGSYAQSGPASQPGSAAQFQSNPYAQGGQYYAQSGPYAPGTQQYRSPMGGQSQQSQQPQRPQQPFGQPSPMPAAPMMAAAPVQPARSPYVRRKPAGFVLVLLILGLTLLSGACCLFVAIANNEPFDVQMRYAMLWSAGVSLAIGLIIAVLGCVGRRAGGLIPVALIAWLTTIAIMVSGIGYGFASTRYTNLTQQSERISVGDYLVLGSSKSDMDRLTKGVAFEGFADPRQGWSDNSSDVNIDLTQYEDAHGAHEITLNNGSVRESGCPTGRISVSARYTDVSITLPDGCSYAWATNDGSSRKGVEYRYDDSWLSSDNNALLRRSFGMVSSRYGDITDQIITFSNPHAQESCADTDDANQNLTCSVSVDRYYEWLRNRPEDPKQPELIIETPTLMFGRVSVEYQSNSTLQGVNE